ncbi:cilia- and flagella-associated protein 54 isoform X2 [Sceloporus undulatus]|uniref:cilia- and flagella-associated protein 54 isoform X2 n=1 Tax=Sceloporus undulatus TaxID=8520 RepID=UPI001C4B6371|nr:cilia- and flagella-associated protein 54 isoform X2 [Sceloporus undulatus]
MAVVPKPRSRSPPLPPPPPAIFYGPLEPGNPVVESFESDLGACLGFLRRKREASSKEQELHRRGVTTLFNIWSNYKARFPDWYYNEKLVKVGDQLVEMKEYKLALSHCYGRYLQQISNVNINKLGLDVHEFKTSFFPNGFKDPTAARTFHVLQVWNICLYKIVCDNDIDLLNQESVKTCFRILTTLQIIMQMTLPHEHLCWLVYNGTIHMYTISRHLMTIGQSAKVLEYLLWACVCMESSVPLLAVHYLTWRATLYAAVCQCYYDCHCGLYGELFARRGLMKIDELKQMENMSSSPLSVETKKKFKEATVKMAALIFKRSAFEPRRRPKSYFRPRVRVNLRELQHLPWPRTITERLLMEMFDCNSSYFLAILEALFDKNRRTLIPGPPVPDEIEVHDVISELCFAGVDILEGGGINTMSNTPIDVSGVINASSTLMQQILAGKNSVSATAVLRFLKMAFSYEEWDSFDHTMMLFFPFLQNQNNTEWKKAESELKLLIIMQPLLSTRKPRHGLCIQGGNIREAVVLRSPRRKSISFQEKTTQTGKTTDEVFLLAKTLYSCVCMSEKVHLPDKEMIIDATMFLWQKCKLGIQKIQISGSNFLKCPQKYQTPKWIHILNIINEVFHSINLGDVNAVTMAEVSLRLTSVMESIADYAVKSESTTVLTEINDSILASEYNIAGMPSLIQKSATEQLQLAYEQLDRAIHGMNQARQVTILPDGTSVLDNCCKKIPVHDQNLSRSLTSETMERSPTGNNFIMDLHIDLIQAQHRVAVKLLNLRQDVKIDGKNIKIGIPAKDINQLKILTEPDIMNKIKKNRLSKALYLMQKATLMLPRGLINTSPNQLLEEALILIQKAEAEQNTLCATLPQLASSVKRKVPPPPILVYRSHCSMAFKPAPFESHVKVSWYSIFGCVAEGSNPKVRLNNYNLKNTGEAIPVDEMCILEVKDLEPNQKYIFAVAAYDSDGKLIGDNIGETTKPILAYPPLSAATVRAHLIQSAFLVKHYTLCKKAFQPLWDSFVSVPCTPVTDVTTVSVSSTLTIPQNRLSTEAISHASPNLLYLFVRSIFIINDITVKDGALFCDSLCFNELKYSRQVARIAECGRMLVAIDLSNWLNDVHYVLQSVVYCYGLIAPLVYHKIPSEPIIQIIVKCLTVLHEIPNTTLQKRSAACFESIQHMIACLCFFAAKVLRSWKEYELAIVVINYGKKLLDSSQTTSQLTEGGEVDEVIENEVPSKRLKAQIAAAEKVNENLEALESNLLKLTKPGQEFTGEEDSLLLYPVVSNWQTKSAFKEVMKFKKSPRFLEYFVKLVYKAIQEEKYSRIIEWADEVQDYFRKRNRGILGIKRGKKKGKRNVSADKKKLQTPDLNKMTMSPTPGKKSKSAKKKYPMKQITRRLSDAQRKENESKKLAYQMLINKLNLRCHVYIKRRRFRWIYVEEMPWRSQLNIYLGIGHFNLFKKRIEEFYNVEVHTLQNMTSYDDLDPEILSLNKSGTIVVTATTEEQMKSFTPPFFKRTTSGKIRRKTDTLDPTPPGSESAPSLSASYHTLQNASSATVSSSSLLDLSTCLTPETDAMMDSTDLTQVSPSVPDKDTDYSSEHSTRDTPRSGQGYHTIKEREKALCYTAMMDHFPKIFLHFRRAVVIAHRGGHWTMLQNACRDLWNYTQEVQSIIKHSPSFHAPFPITKELFHNTIWLSYYLASDALIDMLVDLQASNSIKIIEAEGVFCVPSCVGGIGDYDGGSNLSFQNPFDDMNVVDFPGVHNVVLRTIEILFHLKKWESLVYIAMQFNTITHERYTEQVTPLMVFAQRQLQEKIQFSDSDNPQSCFKHLVTNTGEKVCCRDFIAKRLHSIAKCSEAADEEYFYSSDTKARALVSVPLDVSDTLKCFNESLEKAKHYSRCLKYSRKLLSLYLAHTQEHSERLSRTKEVSSHGKVGFILGAELTYQPEPPDLSEETFSCLGMVQSNAIPRSKLSIVVASYEHTLEALQTNNQQGLKVQAFHELGNLHFSTGNKRAAFKCWCQGLDEVLKIVDALNNWQELDGLSENDIGNLANVSQKCCERFVSRAGIWGCLQGAILAAKTAQHILLYDIKLRTRTCILSAVLFKSLFKVSLPHPEADCDFAQYETDILIPGIDLFADYFRADVANVVASLNFIMYELHCSKHNLIILPLFTLYQYFVSEICRDANKCIEGRILKIKVLTDLGFYTDAFHELCILNRGEKIPWKLPSAYKPAPKLPVFPKFDSSQPLLTNVNLQAIEDVFNRPLNSNWASACDPRIMNILILAKTHFIICLSATLNCVPEKVIQATYCVDTETLRRAGRNTEAFLKGFIPPSAFTTLKREPIVMVVELERNKDLLNMGMLKGILLEEAEERINTVLDTVQNKYGTLIYECSASELEIVTEAKLQLAAIAQQRLQTAFSAALAFSALKILQNATVFKKKSNLSQNTQRKSETHNEGIYTEDSNLLHNVIAREHMNIHIWLRCRLALVTAITAQARGIETMKENELMECSCLISEVQMEAQAFSDVETLADITMQAVMLGLQEKQPVADIKLGLQNIIRLLEDKTMISPPASLTLVQSMLLLADIMRMQAEGDSERHTSKTEQLNLLLLAHTIVIKQLFLLGQSLEEHAEDPTLTTVKMPLKNIYLPHITLLAKVKMRIGHTLALELSCISKPQSELQWLQALRHIETALNLSTASIRSDLELKAELLFRKGKIERHIDSICGNKATLAVETLLEAIKVSLKSYQNYSLIRRAYMEIALQYFFLITNIEESPTLTTLKGRIFKPKPTSRHRVSSEEITALEMYRVQAWIAIRAAAQVSEAILASQQLSGKKAVKLYHVRYRVLQSMPEFALLDLSSSYKDFLDEGYEVRYKVPIMPATQESDGAESMSSDESQGKLKIPWIHVIRYNTYLTRLLNMIPLVAVPKAGEGLFVKEDVLFTSVFDTTITLRLAELHTFLKAYLPVYFDCCLQEPPKQLYGFEKPCYSMTVLEKPTLDSLGLAQRASLGRLTSDVTSMSEVDILTDNKATSTPIKELCVQWYLPSLEKSSKDGETMVLFIFAYNKKPVKLTNIKSFNAANVFCGYLWIPLNRVIAVREKLSDVKQQIEFLIQSEMIPQTVTELPQQNPLAGTRSNATKVSLDEKTKEMVEECISEIKALLSVGSDQSSPVSEIPFDVSLLAIKNLRKLFDPANGCVIIAGSVFNWIVSLLS